MANIDEYIKQIQQAQYGEEVRGSIVNALKKVNDDNNSYVAIKKEVIAAKDIVEEKVNAAKETLTALQVSTQIANEAKSSLNNIISSAISTKKELEQAVLETGEVIARVDNAKSNLDKSITSAGKAELNLQRQIETSNQIKNQLDVSNNTAIELKKNLDVAINEANTAKVKLVEAINNAGNAALEKIETAQSVATRAVETAKAEAVKAIATAGTTETKKVTDEGAKQVQTVQSIGTQETEKVTAEGTKQVGLVKTEGEKHLASVQTAAQEIVADREQITKNATDIADLRQKKADAIVETASGTLLNVKDSANAFFEDFSVYGKSEQAQTTGKNILNIPNIDINTPETVIKCNISEDICISVQEKATVSKSVWRFMALYKNNDKQYITDASLPGVFCATSENPIVSITCRGIMITSGAYTGIMVEYGTTATAYEPYTGGKPSPSPEYPQEIKSVGKLNEDTGKYEVEVTINSSNLFKVTEHTTGYYVDKDGKVQIAKTLGYSWTAAVNNLQKQTVTLHVTTAINTRYRLYCTDLQNTILYKHEDSGANTNDNSHTFNMPDGAKKIYVSVMEIDSAEQAEITLNLGNVTLPYEPYKEQTLTLTSDRPLTKWDRLVEQDGQIGWLYNTGEIMLSEIALWRVQKDNLPDNRTQRIYAILDNAIKNQHCYATKYCSEEPSVSSIKHKDYECITICNGNYLTLKVDRNIGTTSEDYVNYFRENDDKVIYNSTDQEFVPLPQLEQDAIRALQTYYPTTVVSNSEDMEMELSYVADTKNYTDRKIEQAVSAQTQSLANLLSLMPLSTQAAMIENDTNNILNMEVQK